MFDGKVVERVWRLTKLPNDESSFYLEVLRQVFALPEHERYRKPFQVEKGSGGTRQIVPAGTSLGYVHWILSEWMQKAFPATVDYCYHPGRPSGVKAAVSVHQGADGAIVLDLKDAFNQVTFDRIMDSFEHHLHGVEESVLRAIASLLTYQGTAPQGCGSTPRVYNIVVAPIDKEFVRLKKEHDELCIFALSRYVDNICVSVVKDPKKTTSEKWLSHLNLVLEKSRAVIEKEGFEISWTSLFEQPPFEFLGTRIFPDSFDLDQAKYLEFSQRIIHASASDNPQIYYKHILGIYSWARQIYGSDMPLELIELFAHYFHEVRKTPKSLPDVWARQLTHKLPGIH